MLSLRLLISLVLGILILGVAMLTFFLVFEVSLNSIIDLTKTHAARVASKAAVQTTQKLSYQLFSPIKNAQNTTTDPGFTEFAPLTQSSVGYTQACRTWFAVGAKIISDSSHTMQSWFVRFADWSVIWVTVTSESNGVTKMKGVCAQGASPPQDTLSFSYIIVITSDQNTGVITESAGTIADVRPTMWQLFMPSEVDTPGKLANLANQYGIDVGEKGRMLVVSPSLVRAPAGDFLSTAAFYRLQNRTGGSALGWAFVTVTMDYLNGLLADSITTPGSQAYLIDALFEFVSATLPQEQWLTVRNATAAELSSGTYPAGCSRDIYSSNAVGCRWTTASMPILRRLPPAFLTTTGLDATTVEHKGETYVIGSARLELDADISYYSALNMLQVIPLNDVAGDVFVQRNINLGIVFGCFIIAAILGFMMVLKLLQPLDDVAERMMMAAKLQNQETPLEVSKIDEVAALQTAFVKMEKELMRIKGFVPQSLLMAEDEDEAEQLAGIDHTNTQNKSREMEIGEASMSSRRNSVALEMGGLHNGASMRKSLEMSPFSGLGARASAEGNAPTTSANATLRTPVSVAGGDDDIVSRASLRSEYVAGAARLSVHASSLKSTRVAVAVINLRGFNRCVREITPELLIRLCELMASAASESAKEQRGVLDSFSGDHFILTFNAARVCPMATQRACTAVLRFAKELETSKSVKRIKDLVLRQSAGPAFPGARNSQSDTVAIPHLQSPGRHAHPSEALYVCAGVASGMATVGNLGSNEIKRFSIVGEVFSRATELEMIGRERGGMLPFDPPLPYTVIIAARDADDVETAMNIEYVSFQRLKHARAFMTQYKPDGDLCAVARILGEHGAAAAAAASGGENAAKDNEWMYALKAATAAVGKKIAMRNLMFQQLEHRDVLEVKNLIEANADIPHSDILQAMRLLRGAEIGDLSY